MTLLSLQELVEEKDHKVISCRVIIGGATLPKWTEVNYQFAMGQVPTATIIVPQRKYLPSAVAEEASVQIWFGYRVGLNLQERLVFGGAVVDNIGNNGDEVVIECVMDGPRKLSYGYNRRISYDFDDVSAEEAVEALLVLAGVFNYAIDLPPWAIGQAVPQTIEFSTYGEAVNKVSEVDGSPWYAMPTGQVRVEIRDPVPSASYRRIYFSSLLTGTIESQPAGIGNTDARPRILDISRRSYRNEVANFIEVDGAVVVTIGPSGEQNSEQIFESVDGASGQFPNGAYWIPTPPLFQDFTFTNELIDTPSKAFAVAERYFLLKNRLFERVDLPIPGDPDVFLGETVKVIDPQHSGINSLYFVQGYRTSISDGGASTELELTGGPEAGTTGFSAPFAEFYWTYTALHQLTPGSSSNTFNANLGPGANVGAKLCEDLPDDSSNEDQTSDYTPGEDKRMVIIGLDASASQDFDGYIVSYEWTWTDEGLVDHVLTGIRVTIAVDPDISNSIEMTLTVTDDSGRTDSITKTIYTSADYIDPSTNDPANDPSQDDSDNGGGMIVGDCDDCVDAEDCGPPDPPGGPCTDCGPDGEPQPGECNGMTSGYFIAAGGYAMGSPDNRTWNDMSKAAAGVSGDFLCVAAGIIYRSQVSHAIFGTAAGEVWATDDLCETGEIVFTHPQAPRIERIYFDMTTMGAPAQGDDAGDEGGGFDGEIPVYTQGSPGTLTILEAYHQCLAVGFDATTAIIAVAVMMAESSLVSNASNSIGNNPPSTDRGIAQINNYYHPEVTDACAYNTACAITEMFRISSGGANFSPWAAYTAGTYIENLASVHAAIGLDVPPGDDQDGYRPDIPRSFKAWFITNNGEIWSSPDSGRNWGLYKNFLDTFPIYEVLFGPALSNPNSPIQIALFGGDTAVPSSLIRISTNGQGDFVSLQFEGDLQEEISANPGNSIKFATVNGSALLIGFDGGVEPRCWVNNDPLGSFDGWVPTDGITGEVTAVAGGFNGEFLVATADGVFKTADNVNFTQVS